MGCLTGAALILGVSLYPNANSQIGNYHKSISELSDYVEGVKKSTEEISMGKEFLEDTLQGANSLRQKIGNLSEFQKYQSVENNKESLIILNSLLIGGSLFYGFFSRIKNLRNYDKKQNKLFSESQNEFEKERGAE